MNVKNTASPKGRLGYGWFIAAAVFLFNPCINVIDLLPDFFGYIFLLRGLEKWADLCPNTADGVAGIKRLRWFMLLKLLSFVLVPLVDNTFVLIFVFAFGIVELIYALPAIGRIFDGLEYFGTRFDSRLVFSSLPKPVKTPKNPKKAKRQSSPKTVGNIKDVRLFTNIFFIVKTATCLLPELCSLSTFEYSGFVTNGVQIDFAQYRGFLVSFNLVVVSVLGILWLISVVRYTARVFSDTPFLVRVLHDYEIEIANDVGLATRRNLRSVISLFVAGIIFIPNMWIDGVNVIPTLIGALLIMGAMLTLSKRAPVKKAAIVAPAALAVVSAAAFAASTWFGLNFRVADVYRRFETYDAFNLTRITSGLELVVLALVMFFVYRELYALVDAHLKADADVNDSRLRAVYAAQLKAARRGVTVGAVLFGISFVANAAYAVLRADIAADFWLAPFVLTIIWIAYTASNLNQFYSQVEYKYM